MICHNTLPYLYRFALPDGLEGFPELGRQIALEPLLADLAGTMGVKTNVKEHLDPKNLVTMGISCEACHFGCADHVKSDGNAPTSYLPQSPWIRWVGKKDAKLVASSTTDPRVMNGVCAQCHCATITRFPNGAGTWNSREALDMIEGACASKIRCIDCHDPHTNDGAEGAPVVARHINSCKKCHDKFATPESEKAHSKHGESVTCLDCHMPRMTQGLEEVVRTHRISSPTDVRMLEKGSGNSCNLCHLDKPITWTLEQLEKQYSKKIAPTPAWNAFYGEKLEKPVGLAWLKGADPSMRLVATQAYAREARLGAAAMSDLIDELDDPIAVNRVFDTFAIGRLAATGDLSRADFDVTAPTAERRKKIETLHTRLRPKGN
jgi:hypothetical protein